MNLREPKKRPSIKIDLKLEAAYNQLNSLIILLNQQKISLEVQESINTAIEGLNSISDEELKNHIKKVQINIVQQVEKEHKIVVKNHYRNYWLALGMAVFGIPIGVIFGSSMGNMAFLGIGLPIGMVIGLAVGSEMDKKAFKEGRQINLELKH